MLGYNILTSMQTFPGVTLRIQFLHISTVGYSGRGRCSDLLRPVGVQGINQCCGDLVTVESYSVHRRYGPKLTCVDALRWLRRDLAVMAENGSLPPADAAAANGQRFRPA